MLQVVLSPHKASTSEVGYFRVVRPPYQRLPVPFYHVSRLVTRLQLRKVLGLYYISRQEDFYHTVVSDLSLWNLLNGC